MASEGEGVRKPYPKAFNYTGVDLMATRMDSELGEFEAEQYQEKSRSILDGFYGFDKRHG